MTDRLKELAGQALDKVVPYTWTTLDYEEVQKLQLYFATQLLEEAITVMKANDYHGEWLGEKLKEHFGIKE